MKITVNKDMTPVSQMKATKDAAKQFKAQYTDNDISRMFAEAFPKFFVYGEPIKTDVDVFPKMYGSDEMTFCIYQILFDGCRFRQIHYFLDPDGVNKDPVLYSFTEYRPVQG